jgi:rRNA maturation protein Nop10
MICHFKEGNTLKKCPTCGSVVPQGHGYKPNKKYCSARCAYDKNIPPREDLLTELNRTKNVTVTAQLFGVNRQALNRWMMHYGIVREVAYMG